MLTVPEKTEIQPGPPSPTLRELVDLGRRLRATRRVRDCHDVTATHETIDGLLDAVGLGPAGDYADEVEWTFADRNDR